MRYQGRTNKEGNKMTGNITQYSPAFHGARPL